MTIKNSFKIAIIGLKTNKSRSWLTILGIVIGIGAIMMIMSVGRGAEKLILGEFSGMGAEMIVIKPGKEPKGPTEMVESLLGDSLKDREVNALKKKSNVPGIINLVPAVFVFGSASYLGETFNPIIFGWSAEFMADIYDTYPEEGTLFDDNDIKQKASVAVIGSRVKKELFGFSDAVGKNIKIKNKNFKVVGVLPPKGQASLFDIDKVIVLPYTTAQTYLMGTDYYHEIIAMAESPEAVNGAVFDIKATLRELHNITNPDKDDFFIVTQQGMVEQVKNVMSALTIFLSLVVAVSLIVGGVGVMNIMLVSVTERTREIGLRKSVGATKRDILIQFLFESVILTFVGGFIGIAIGTLFSFAASIILTEFYNFAWAFSFPLSAALLGLSVSSVVGLVFGIYPARQAAGKNPIEALRYE